jgi:hypothetical protein
MLWSDKALYVRFASKQYEPLVVSDRPDRLRKTVGLWDRDVCEIFIAPDSSHTNKYFEFEVAPTGEWVDVAIEVLEDGRHTNIDYRSGMTAAARIENDRVISAIRVPWQALGLSPSIGERCRGNIYRCVGKDPSRGYLAWQPTFTAEPSFHVPDRFGYFEFAGKSKEPH